MAIDVGAAAIDRNTSWTGTYTFVDNNNPANADGTIDTWEIWANTNMTGAKVGTMFLISGTTYECRDIETIGNVTAGSKQTFSGLSTDVLTGDNSAGYAATGNWEESSSGFVSVNYDGQADKLTIGLQTNFSANLAGDAVSLYGTGVEAGGGGWVNIAKVDGIAEASIASVGGVVKASIAKINGIAV